MPCEMENMWKLIEHERVNGYEHRQPNRRTVTPSVIECNKNIQQLNSNSGLIQRPGSIQRPGLNLMFKNTKEPPKCLLKIIKT